MNSDCIVETLQGEHYVKVLRKGATAQRYRLQSYNPRYEDIEVQIKWAAPVEIIKRR